MIQEGVVVKRIDENKVLVECSSPKACDKCGVCFKSGDKQFIEAQDTLQTKIGERVQLEINPSNVLTATFLIFIMPIICLIAGYYVAGVLSAFLSILLYLIGLWACDKYIFRKKIYCKVVGIISKL